MNLILKDLYAPLILFIIITETTGIDSDESLPDENQPDVRGRMIKSYSGAKPEPITCTGEGFVKDPHNCAMFFRCMKSGNNKYTIFRFQCGPGTVYDPDLEVCNHPQFTKRSECGGISPTFAHTTHINDIQDNMYNEIPSPMVSDKPVHPSYSLQKTSTMNVKQTPPSDAVSSTTEFYITSTPASSYTWASSIKPISTDRNLHKTTMKPPDTETKISHPISRDNICISDGFMGDNKNCRKFYRCVANQNGGFTRFEFMCSETTVWDEESQICNHVWAVKKSRCSLYNEKVTDTNMQITTGILHIPEKNTMDLHMKENQNDNAFNTIQHQLQIGYGTKVTQSQIQIGNDFVVQNQTQVNYGDRLNQNRKKGSKQNQTQINHGSAVSQSQIQVDYGNKGVQTQLQIDHSKDASQSQIQISETSTKKGSTTTWQSTNQEQSKPESTNCIEDGFIGDSTDCRKFYRCVNNGQGGFKKFEFNCADGTAWDPSIKSCNHIWAVQECYLHGSVESSPHTVKTTTYRTTQSYHTTISTERTTTQLIEDNENSDSVGYGNSEPELMQTPSSSTIIMTVHDSNGTECLSNGFMGDNNDCKIFYRCIENGNGGFTKHTFQCGEGTLWDPEIKACNHAWAVVKCGGNISPDINKVEKTTEKIKTSTPIYVQNTTSTHLPTVSSDEHKVDDENNVPGYGSSNNDIQITTTRNQHTTESIPVDEKCTQSGFMGSSRDCKQFYRCVDDGNGSYIRYEFMCGEGTLWDQELKSCNYAWAVTNCGSNGESSPISNEVNHNNPQNENFDSQTSITTIPFPDSAATTKHETASELCVSSGFFGDTKHCEKFYRCVEDGKGSFIRYEYICAEGTVWDQSLKACNHRWAVQECNITKNTTTNVSSEGTTEYTIIITTSLKYEDSPVTQNISEVLWSKNDSSVICTKEGFVADPKNCKSFYRCVNDGKGGLTKYQYNCGDGTYWNHEILSCDHITSDKICEPGYSSTPKLPHTQEEIIPETTTVSRDHSYEQSPPSKPMETLATCTSEGYYGDQHDCRKYYRCVNNGKGDFTMYNFSCEEGTSWNKDFHICTYEALGRCTDLTSSESTQNPFQQENSAMTSEKLNTSSTSMEQCELEGFFAVKNDCKKFIRCVSNNQGGFIKYEFACSEGTVWVQEMLTCYHDTGEAYCNPQIMTKPVTNEYHPQTTEKYVPSSSEHLPGNDENENTIKPPPNSADICLSEGYYPDEKDCRRFYECVSNGKGSFTKYDYSCFKGTAWDNNTQKCNYFNRVSSCQEPVMMNDDEGTTPTTESSRSTTQGLTSSSTSTTTSSTPDSNLHSMDVCESEGYFGDSQDCKKFYRCVHNDKGGYTKYDFTCAEGTIWDKDIPTCNHPENVANPSCYENPTNSDSISNTTESTEDQSEISKTPENNNINCTKAGFYPNPNNCKKFYRCVDWDGNETKFSIFHFECGEGTIWDPALDTCNHEDSVYPPRNCSGFHSPMTEETTTTDKESTTKSQESTEVITQSTSTSTTQPTTEPATTESATQTTTERLKESTTEQSAETTTDRSGEASTEHPPESTTERLGESTTEYTGQTTTEQSGETTTEQLGEKTTKESVESTTEQLGESTTEKLGESTTEKIEESTTEKLKESTTEIVKDSTTEKIGENTTEESVETTSTTEQSSESTTKESIENTTTEGLGTVQTTTEQVETTESGTDNSTQKPTGSDCPQTENDQNLFVCPSSFKRHPRYCNLFYQCDENEDSHELKIAIFTCPNNTIYDESKTKCVNESKADKSCSGEISEKRRVKRKERIGNIINDPLVVSEKSYGCSKTGYFAFEKEGDCSKGFLKCTSTKSNKLRGLVYQCPESYIFWNVSKRCEPLYKIRDCKRSFVNDWSRRSNIPIEIQNVAW